MGLSIKDCVRGTIVDWKFKYDAEERAETLRNPWYRGIIVKVVGGNDAVGQVWVKFGDGEEAKAVPPRELVRYLPYNSKRARRELARIDGNRELTGGIYESRPAAVRPKGIDRLGLTPRKAQAVVEPEYEEESDVAPEGAEPIVIPDTEDETKD